MFQSCDLMKNYLEVSLNYEPRATSGDPLAHFFIFVYSSQGIVLILARVPALFTMRPIPMVPG